MTKPIMAKKPMKTSEMKPPLSPQMLVYVTGVACIFVLGYLWSPHFDPNAFKVEPTYLNGILTASGILYGLWALVLEREPKTPTEVRRKKMVGTLFFDSFFFLIASVLSIAFTAMNLFLSTFALLLCTTSFMLNTVSISVTLYFYEFRFPR